MTKRNQDFDFAEDNNRQLLSLLEKYDNKLDELQEDLEIRELKIIEYEKDMSESKDKIKIESLEEKIQFITAMLGRLKDMHEANIKEGRPSQLQRHKKGGKVNEPTEQSISESIDKLTNDIMIQIQDIERQAKAQRKQALEAEQEETAKRRMEAGGA